MTTPTQLAPFLTVLTDDGDFTLRVDDSALAKTISPLIVKAIGEVGGAKRLTLITPTDIKVFKLSQSSALAQAETPVPAVVPSPAAVERVQRGGIVQDESAPPSPELSDYEREMAEAAAAAAEQARLNGEVVEFPTTPSPDPTPAKRERNKRPEPSANPQSACGRCGGMGHIDGGGTCPVCRGTGAVAKWGRRR